MTIAQNNDLINESRFCYGCLQFTVDAPETENQACWCYRGESKEGVATFKLIGDKIKVRQCPNEEYKAKHVA